MKVGIFLAMLCLSSCMTAPPVGTCTHEAVLPTPPPPGRSLPTLVKWANTAASVANKAIIERDLCAGSYKRLEEWTKQRQLF
jgi:hypothetical protein